MAARNSARSVDLFDLVIEANLSFFAVNYKAAKPSGRASARVPIPAPRNGTHAAKVVAMFLQPLISCLQPGCPLSLSVSYWLALPGRSLAITDWSAAGSESRKPG